MWALELIVIKESYEEGWEDYLSVSLGVRLLFFSIIDQFTYVTLVRVSSGVIWLQWSKLRKTTTTTATYSEHTLMNTLQGWRKKIPKCREGKNNRSTSQYVHIVFIRSGSFTSFTSRPVLILLGVLSGLWWNVGSFIQGYLALFFERWMRRISSSQSMLQNVP